MLTATTNAHAAQGRVGLGTAESFAVLAYSGVTNTGATTITGDIGTFPTTTTSGFGTVTLIGTNHAGDAVTQDAKNDLTTAYNDAAGRNPWTNVPVELGGSTLNAGVYRSGTFGLTGTLTLDAKGDTSAQFSFQAASTLITASNSRVRLLGGANPCQVVWQVGSSATFDTGTRFVGDVLAHTSIQAKTSATFQGRLLARNGAVTLDHNTITNANCTSSLPGGGGTGTSPSPTPVAITSTGSGSGSPGPGSGSTGTDSGATGTPAATPVTTTGTGGGPPTDETARTPSAGPPFLPLTGLSTPLLPGIGLTLLGLGTVRTMAGRRRRNQAAG
jgi:type VI secretion system secreted protein VgrG